MAGSAWRDWRKARAGSDRAVGKAKASAAERAARTEAQHRSDNAVRSLEAAPRQRTWHGNSDDCRTVNCARCEPVELGPLDANRLSIWTRTRRMKRTEDDDEIPIRTLWSTSRWCSRRDASAGPRDRDLER